MQAISTEPTTLTQHNNPNKIGLTMNEHTLTQLRSLRLDGMVRALEEQATSTLASALGFDERLTSGARQSRTPLPTGTWLAVACTTQ